MTTQRQPNIHSHALGVHCSLMYYATRPTFDWVVLLGTKSISQDLEVPRILSETDETIAGNVLLASKSPQPPIFLSCRAHEKEEPGSIMRLWVTLLKGEQLSPLFVE
jgi:hypothetical protein